MFRRKLLLAGCRSLLCVLVLAPLASLAQQPAAPPQKTPPVTHSAAALAVDGELSATGQSSAAANPLMAVVDAIQKCERQRVAKKIARACEPVRVDQENIASAAELRDKAQQQPGALSL
ncbi:MAG: hypothetical protein ACR2PS_15800, partial [Pseudomonadales bacterium]